MNAEFFLGHYERALALGGELEPGFAALENAVWLGVAHSRMLLCRALLGQGGAIVDEALEVAEGWLDRELVSYAANPVGCCLGAAALSIQARGPGTSSQRERPTVCTAASPAAVSSLTARDSVMGV